MPDRSRQIVTGLRVNAKVNVDRRYVRNLRAVIHAWEKFGLEAAEAHFIAKDKRYRSKFKPTVNLKSVINGKLAFLKMVKGANDKVLQGLYKKLNALDPISFPIGKESRVVTNTGTQAIIYTEGKSDAIHLQAALSRLKQSGKFADLDILIDSCDEDRGDTKLKAILNGLSHQPQAPLSIGVFDRDNLDHIKGFYDLDSGFRDLGNNVYSLAIPLPRHRDQTPGISIEHYYTDAKITTLDKDGRRLYLSNEFSGKSGKLLADGRISTIALKEVNRPNHIIDSKVFDETSKSIALSKVEFASKVASGETGFGDFDLRGFELLFTEIVKIVNYHSRKISVRGVGVAAP